MVGGPVFLPALRLKPDASASRLKTSMGRPHASAARCCSLRLRGAPFSFRIEGETERRSGCAVSRRASQTGAQQGKAASDETHHPRRICARDNGGRRVQQLQLARLGGRPDAKLETAASDTVAEQLEPLPRKRRAGRRPVLIGAPSRISAETPIFTWCPRPDSNRHSGCPETDFKSVASTRSATRASRAILLLGRFAA
jgi:hypothetical protein